MGLLASGEGREGRRFSRTSRLSLGRGLEGEGDGEETATTLVLRRAGEASWLPSRRREGVVDMARGAKRSAAGEEPSAAGKLEEDEEVVTDHDRVGGLIPRLP